MRSHIKPSIIYKWSYHIIVLIMIVISFYTYHFNQLRFLKYIAPFILIIFLILLKNKNIIIKNYMYPFILLIVVYYLKVFQYNPQGYLESIFIFSALAIFMLPYSNKVYLDIRVISVVSILFMIILYLITFSSVNIDFSYNAFLRSETSTIEGDMAFLFGLFVMYFILEKKYIWAILNSVMLLMGLKRIVFLGLLVVTILLISPRVIKKTFANKHAMVIINICYLIFTMYLLLGMFDTLIEQYTGISAGYFLMGRSSIYSSILPYWEENKLMISLIGSGMGTSNQIIQSNLGFHQLLHNDVLKIFFEHGFIIFIAFFYLLFNTSNKKHFYMALLVNMIFLTDNMLIYTHILLIYFAISNNYYIEANE